jgi:hypothetical protein
LKPGDIFNPWKLFTGLFVPNALARFPGLSSSAKLVYERLAQYAGKDGRCFPSQETLVGEVGLSKSRIQQIIAELVKCRFIRMERPKGRDRLNHLNASYVFLWHEIFTNSYSPEIHKTVSPESQFSVSPIQGIREIHLQDIPTTGERARTKKPFVPPSLAEVQAYCQERKTA